MERKFSTLEDVTTADGTVTGYASVFGGVDSYGDTINKGAYSATIKDATKSGGLPLLWQHNPNNLIGRWTGMEEDTKGLKVTGVLTPGHSMANDAYASLKAGHLNGLSIGFSIPSGGSVERQDGGRTLQRIKLHEISLVTMPADKAAMITDVRAVDMELREFRDLFRKAMRDAGLEMSRSEAEAFMALGFKGLTATRDAGGAVDAEAAKAAFLDAIRLR